MYKVPALGTEPLPRLIARFQLTPEWRWLNEGMWNIPSHYCQYLKEHRLLRWQTMDLQKKTRIDIDPERPSPLKGSSRIWCCHIAELEWCYRTQNSLR